MKLGPVTKGVKRNTAMLKKIDDDVISTNCCAIVIFPIYGQFGATWKQDFGHMIFKIYYLSLIVTFNLIKTEKRTKKYLTQL